MTPPMGLPKKPVNQTIRDWFEKLQRVNSEPLPTLQLGTEVEQLSFQEEQIEALVSTLFENRYQFFEAQQLKMQTGVVGSPVQRRFGATSDGTFLNLSIGSSSLPFGCIDHTPGSEFTELAPFRRLSKIVSELSGTILVTDIGGKLRRIRCVLPVTQEPGKGQGGRETILLVEDEEFVRNVTREVLELSGYTVLEAIDAENGIKVFEQHSEVVDLLLTDVVMPGMNGHDLALKLFEMSPSLRAIFMSGYTENAITRQGFSDPRLVYLQKPFTLDVLTKKVREVLDTPMVPASTPGLMQAPVVLEKHV